MVDKTTTRMMPTRFAIGIDLGATTVKAGLVSSDGVILDQATADAMGAHGPEAVLGQISGVIRELLARHGSEGCCGIGIGSPGVVTSGDGIVRHPPNFARWGDVDVAAPIRAAFPFPVCVANDANAAAMAEARYGAGKEFKDFLFVIWGTGIGGGIILDHQIFAGPHGGAGELGHVTIDHRGPLCGCGNRGCIEAYVGQRYLSERTRERVAAAQRSGARSVLADLAGGDLSRIEPALIARAAESGDPIAREMFTEAGELVGAVLASAMNLLDLHVAVIGGGISAAPEFVYDAMRASATSRVLTPHRAGLRVVRAALGNPAGIIGAAALVL